MSLDRVSPIRCKYINYINKLDEKLDEIYIWRLNFY